MPRAHTSPVRQPTEVALVVGVTVLAAFLRWYGLGAKSLWLDEAVVYGIAQGDLATIVRANAEGNSAPPLFALLLHAVTRVARSEAALRAFSALAATAAVPMLYVLARRWTTSAAATLCATLAACAPAQVEIGQEVREYAVAMLLASALLLVLARLWERPAWRDLVAWCLLGALSVWTQYGLALLLLLGGGLLTIRILTTPPHRRFIGAWVGANALVGLAVIGVVIVSLQYQFRAGGFGADGQSAYLAAGYWDGSLRSFGSLAARGTYTILRFGFPRPILVLPMVVLGLWACWRDHRARLPLLVFTVSFAGVFGAALARLYPYQGGHQIVLLMPMLYVMAGAGFDALRSLVRWRWVPLVVGVLLAANSLVGTVAYLRAPGKEEMRPVVQILANNVRPDDTIYVYYGAVPAFRYYHRNEAATVVEGEERRGDPAAYQRQPRPLLSGTGRVWLLFAHCYADECERIVERAGAVRPLERRAVAPGATLYLAP